MNNEINLFDERYNPHGYSIDHRWDMDKNASLLNIVFVNSTFGNFLKYFIERFSTKTPEMKMEPFTDIGTSHSIDDEQFSGLVQKYHLSFINDNKGETDLPICLIMPRSNKHFLYLKKAQLFRTGDIKIKPDHLWQKAVGEMSDKLQRYVKQIIELYEIKETAHFTWLPKFIVRDWYKLEFLQDIKDTEDGRFFETLRTHDFFKEQKTFELDLESFFDWSSFIKNIKELDAMFGLAIDFDKESDMKKVFDKGLELDELRQECNLADDVVGKGLDVSLSDLDVSTEAYIYAEVEKKNDFVQMPLTNRFFRDTGEMEQFVEHYPSHYKAMNPNMTEFNGKPNPFYLRKGK